jgi:hypothetical protein
VIIFIRLFTPPLGDIQILLPGKGNFHIRLNYLAYDILSNSLSKEDYHAFIMNYNESICDAHDIWTRIKTKFDEFKYDGSFCASTSFSLRDTNPCKEEEENER